MKKHILSAVAVAALSASAAMAQADQEINYDVTATVAGICTVSGSGATNTDIDFGELSTVASTDTVERVAGQLFYRCNSAGGFVREIESDNGGFMLRDGNISGSGNQIAYEISHGGGSGLGLPYQQPTGVITTNLGGSTAFLSGQGGTFRFRTNGVGSGGGTTVFAGDYSDVLTVSITAN